MTSWDITCKANRQVGNANICSPLLLKNDMNILIAGNHSGIIYDDFFFKSYLRRDFSILRCNLFGSPKEYMRHILLRCTLQRQSQVSWPLWIV